MRLLILDEKQWDEFVAHHPPLRIVCSRIQDTRCLQCGKLLSAIFHDYVFADSRSLQIYSRPFQWNQFHQYCDDCIDPHKSLAETDPRLMSWLKSGDRLTFGHLPLESGDG